MSAMIFRIFSGTAVRMAESEFPTKGTVLEGGEEDVQLCHRCAVRLHRGLVILPTSALPDCDLLFEFRKFIFQCTDVAESWNKNALNASKFELHSVRF